MTHCIIDFHSSLPSYLSASSQIKKTKKTKTCCARTCSAYSRISRWRLMGKEWRGTAAVPLGGKVMSPNHNPNVSVSDSSQLSSGGSWKGRLRTGWPARVTRADVAQINVYIWKRPLTSSKHKTGPNFHTTTYLQTTWNCDLQITLSQDDHQVSHWPKNLLTNPFMTRAALAGTNSQKINEHKSIVLDGKLLYW